MFRPAKLGRDPGYGLGDPGHEYIDGVTESWLGPLAQEWGVHGGRATLAERARLYRHRSPDGRTDLLPHVSVDRYRPVHGGVFHSTKTLDAWLVEQSDETRRKAKGIFARCVTEVYEEHIAGNLYARAGRGGTETVPVKTVAAAFVHEVNGANHYHLHVHLEVHNVGRSADGKYRAFDNYPLFQRQQFYSLAFQGRLITALRQELGLSVKQGPAGPVVAGYEHLLRVKTPRQEQIEAKLAEKGIPHTPRSRHYAALETHTRRDPTVTVRDAVSRSLAWLRSKGHQAARTATAAAQATSVLMAERQAERAVKHTVKVMRAAGRHTTVSEFEFMARNAAERRGADLARVEAVLCRVEKQPERFGLTVLKPGVLTCDRIEKSRAKWGGTLGSLADERTRPPGADALRIACARNPKMGAHHVTHAIRAMENRVQTTREEGPTLKFIQDAHMAGGKKRRVFVVSAETTARPLRHTLKGPVHDPDALAARLGKTPLWPTFLELRRHRIRSLGHAIRLTKQIRKPKERLTRHDLVIIDTRGASHHAVAAVVDKAKKAKAAVIVITPEPVITHYRARTQAVTPQL